MEGIRIDPAHAENYRISLVRILRGARGNLDVQSLTNFYPTAAAFCSLRLHAQGHPLDAAPFLRITSRHTFHNPNAVAAATLCAFLVLRRRFTRSRCVVFPKGGRCARRSAVSRARKSLRSQDQNFSMGFRSGLLGAGIHVRVTHARKGCKYDARASMPASARSASAANTGAARTRRCSNTDPPVAQISKNATVPLLLFIQHPETRT